MVPAGFAGHYNPSLSPKIFSSATGPEKTVFRFPHAGCASVGASPNAAPASVARRRHTPRGHVKLSTPGAFSLLNARSKPHACGVRKTVLGKGLRALLNGTPIPGKPEQPLPNSDRSAQVNGPGLESLLRGEGKPVPGSRSSSSEPANSQPLRRHWTVLKWVLLTADRLLLSLASLLVFKNSGPLTFVEWVLCLLALAIGAALAFFALLGNSNRLDP